MTTLGLSLLNSHMLGDNSRIYGKAAMGMRGTARQYVKA